MRAVWQKIWRPLLVVLLFWGCFRLGQRGIEVFFTLDTDAPAILLDPGHGGEDGGAVSPNGMKESDLNLQISVKLDQILALLGAEPMLLREDDVSLHDPTAVTLREKKMSDLKYRAALAAEYPHSVWVSIHQNTYPEGKYRGTQVFFAPTGGSEQLARTVQSAVVEHLQPGNNRKAKAVPDTVYLLNHIENQGVLVECGFLSNPEEERLLQEQAYQRQLALVLGVSLVQQLG